MDGDTCASYDQDDHAGVYEGEGCNRCYCYTPC